MQVLNKPHALGKVAAVAATAGLCATFAAAENLPVDCQNAVTQYDMNICAGRDFEVADGDLNATYQVAINDWLGGRDTPNGQALRNAQRAWLVYRDAHCTAAAGIYEGGSMQPMVYAFCLADLTRARTETIRTYAEPF